MRAFLAVKINNNVQTELARIQKKLQKQIKTAVWTKPANVHLTLAFFEDISDQQIKFLQKAGESVCSCYSPFDLQLGPFNAFPHLKRAQILYLELQGDTKKLLRLTHRLRRKLDHYRLPFDHQPFVPHLTLARLKRPKDLTVLASAIKPLPIILPVSSFDLTQSRLKTTGPIYSSLVTFYLHQNNPCQDWKKEEGIKTKDRSSQLYLNPRRKFFHSF